MLQKYKVIALSVGGLGNKIFSAGDVVKENQFPEGNADRLVKQGFLKPIEEAEDKVPEKSKPEKPKGKGKVKEIDKGTPAELTPPLSAEVDKPKDTEIEPPAGV